MKKRVRLGAQKTPKRKPCLSKEREARLFFVSFLQFRVVSGGFGRAIAPLARPGILQLLIPSKVSVFRLFFVR